MGPITLGEAAQVLVVVWLAASLVALTVLYMVHLLEQRRSSGKRPEATRLDAMNAGARDRDGSTPGRARFPDESAKRDM